MVASDDVDCIHRYVCFLCGVSASAPRLSAYAACGDEESVLHFGLVELVSAVVGVFCHGWWTIAADGVEKIAQVVAVVNQREHLTPAPYPNPDRWQGDFDNLSVPML
jgi:hypothetical protein